MKKIIYPILSLLLLLSSSSCEEYLDVERASLDLTEEDVFGNFYEYRDFLNHVYHDNYYLWCQPYYGAKNGGWKFTAFPTTASDQVLPVDNGVLEDLYFNVSMFSGRFTGYTNFHHHLPIWAMIWEINRVSNVAIAKIDLLDLDEEATQEMKDGILGQAYMGRATAYMYTLNIWGGMHYLKEPLSDPADFDQERLSYYETALEIANDCDLAAQYLPARWDDGPGSVNENDSEDTHRFTSVYAKALKARALLYAASPLAQEGKPSHIITTTQQDWEAAALAAYEAITFAESNGMALLSGDAYTDNFYGEWITSESIFTLVNGHVPINATNRNLAETYIPHSLTKSNRGHAVGATHDIAERFEAVEYDASGNIINAAPITGGAQPAFYNPQNPFHQYDPADQTSADWNKGRDPRFYTSMIYHGRDIPSLTAARPFDLTEGSVDKTQASAAWNNVTGYYTGKFWNGSVTGSLGAATSQPHLYPLCRLSELYLNLAEAANQAYGDPADNTAGMSAADALNTVRNRVGMPNTTATTKDEFHERVMNERFVELCFESNHAFVDVRRWKMIETEEYRKVYSMVIVPNPTGVTPEYPTGYIFTPTELKANYKPFETKHYFFPVAKNDVDKCVNFKQNPGY